MNLTQEKRKNKEKQEKAAKIVGFWLHLGHKIVCAANRHNEDFGYCSNYWRYKQLFLLDFSYSKTYSQAQLPQ